MLGCVMIPMTCDYLRLPTFVGRSGWGSAFFWFSLPHFAVRWRMLRGPVSLVPDPTNEGASRVLKKDVVVSALLIV